MWPLSQDPLLITAAAVITALILGRFISATFQMAQDWGAIFVYALTYFCFPILMPLTGMIIGPWAIFIAVRWINRRDDPQFVGPSAPNPDATREAD